MKNGVTLLVLVVAISVMFVIISSASVIGINSINQANYEEYKSMIKRVSDDINNYYLTNNELPINNEIISVDSLGMDFSNNVKNNKDENDTFYIVNIDKLNNQTIKNGRGTLQNKDIFLIAKNSNNLYYLRGFNFNGKTNYSSRNEENTANSTADNIERYVKTGLVLHYDGINNTGTSHSNTSNIWKDLSGNGNDGILYGFNYNERSGWINNSLNFNNDSEWGDYVAVPSIVNIPVEYTIEFVINYTDYRDKTYHGISFMGTRSGLFNGSVGDGETGFEIHGYGNNRRLRLTLKDSLDSLFLGDLKSPINEAIPMSVSNKVTIIKTLNNATLYVNSNKYNTVQFSLPINETVARRTLVINGRGGGASSYQFIGKIYSVRIYNRVLSDSEITQNYQVDIERFGILI